MTKDYAPSDLQDSENPAYRTPPVVRRTGTEIQIVEDHVPRPDAVNRPESAPDMTFPVTSKEKETSHPRTLPSNCAQILLVEDNAGDARLTREVFKDARITNQLHIVADGVEAIRFLRKEGPYRDSPRPDLILLDLNLPRKDGREVLADIKADPALQSIPVVVLTTSAADEDVDNTYRLHANSFITKPVDLDDFIKVVRSIESFWLTIVRLPH